MPHPDMYITRPEFERVLRSGLAAGYHIVIRGQSGNGKSCLYRTVLENQGTYFASCNLATADRLSFSGLFSDFLAAARISTSSETARTGKVTAGPVGIDVNKKEKYFDPDLFRLVLEECRRKAGDRPAALILDNLEAISGNPARMKELANIIMLLDEQAFVSCNVTLIIVGATGPFFDYYKDDPVQGSLKNRICELPEVEVFTERQADEFILRGVGLLGLRLEADIQGRVLGHIREITGRVPLRLNEYGRALTELAEVNSRVVSLDLLRQADANYLRQADVNYSGHPPAPPPPSPAFKSKPDIVPPPKPKPNPKPGTGTVFLTGGLRSVFKFFKWSWVVGLLRALGWLVAILLCFAVILYVALYLYFRFVF